MIHFNLGSHDGRTIDELTSLVEVTERAAFTTNNFCGDSTRDENVDGLRRTVGTDSVKEHSARTVSTQSDPQINSGDSNADSERDSLASPAPRVLSPEPSFAKRFGCHGANQAHDAGRETFPGQFDSLEDGD